MSTTTGPLLSLSSFDPLVSSHIANIFDKEISEAKKINPFVEEELQYLKKLSTVNGKKLRAYLIYIASIVDKKDDTALSTEVLDLAAAMEIFHTAVLIHDDIEDQSLLRRGMDSYHIHEAKQFKSDIIGESLAINFGSTGLFLSMNIINNSKYIDENIRIKLLDTFTRNAIMLSYGQAYDISTNIQSAPNLTFAQILKLCNLKTGVYTFLLPLQLGRFVQGRTIEKALEQYAYYSGLVFQLTDDYLDIFSDTSGKDLCNDIAIGKVNSIVFLTLKNAKRNDRTYMLRLLKGKEKEMDVARIRDIIERSGAAKELERYINRYTKKAIDAVKGARVAQEKKAVLIGIVESLNHRGK